MPKQPQNKRTDPNRRMQTPNTNFAALKGTPKTQVQKFTPRDPGLLKDSSSVSTMTVGQQTYKPVGTPVGTGLANLLNAGMKAAQAGVSAYNLEQDVEDQKQRRADKMRSDREREDKESYDEMRIRILERQNSEDYLALGDVPNQQLDMLDAIYDEYSFESNRFKNTAQIDRLELALKRPEANYDTLVNKTQAEIDRILSGPLRDTEEGARAIGEYMKVANEIANSGFLDPKTQQAWAAYNVKLTEASDKRYIALADDLMQRNAPALTKAHETGLELLNNGTMTWGSYDEYQDWLLEEAGVELADPDGIITRHMADRQRQVIEDGWKKVEKKKKDKTIERTGYNYDTAQTRFATAPADQAFSPSELNELNAAREAYITSGASTKQIYDSDVKAMEVLINGLADRFDVTMKEGERRPEIEKIVAATMEQWGLFADTPGAKNARAKIMGHLQSKDLDALAHLVSQDNVQGLGTLALRGEGTEMEQARQVFPMALSVRSAPAVGVEVARASLAQLDASNRGMGNLAWYMDPFTLNDSDEEVMMVASEHAFREAVSGNGDALTLFREALKGENMQPSSDEAAARMVSLFQGTAAFQITEDAADYYDRGGSYNEFHNRLMQHYEANGGKFDDQGRPEQIETRSAQEIRAQAMLAKPNGKGAEQQGSLVALDAVPGGVANFRTNPDQFVKDTRKVLAGIERDPAIQQAMQQGDIDGQGKLLNSLLSGALGFKVNDDLTDAYAESLVQGVQSEAHLDFLARFPKLVMESKIREGRDLIYADRVPKRYMFLYENTNHTDYFEGNPAGMLTETSVNTWANSRGLVVVPADENGKGGQVLVDPQVSFRSSAVTVDRGPDNRRSVMAPDAIKIDQRLRNAIDMETPAWGAAYEAGAKDEASVDKWLMAQALGQLTGERPGSLFTNANIPAEVSAGGVEMEQKFLRFRGLLRDQNRSNISAGSIAIMGALIENGTKPFSQYTDREIEAFKEQLVRNVDGTVQVVLGTLDGESMGLIPVPDVWADPYRMPTAHPARGFGAEVLPFMINRDAGAQQGRYTFGAY